MRAVDVVVAVFAILATLPLQGLLVLYVMIIDGAPTLHRDERLGRHGEVFGLLKIRSMRRRPGAAVTAADDPRILPGFRLLRRLRLDELPQLWQVLSGKLALVGPRPESPRLVIPGDPREARLLELRPGLIDPTMAAALDEELELAGRDDPESWYRARMRPAKLDRYLDWLEHRSVLRDLRAVVAIAATLVMPRTGR